MPMRRKRKPTEVETSPMDTEDAAPAEEPATLPPPEPQPPMPAPPEPAPSERVVLKASLQSCVHDARQMAMRMKRELQKEERKWEKKLKTHHQYSPFCERSVRLRVEERMFQADIDLGNARAEHAWFRMRWLRMRTFHLISKRFLYLSARDELTNDIVDLKKMAMDRLRNLPPQAHWRSTWPGLNTTDFWGRCARDCGMALSWGQVRLGDYYEVDKWDDPKDRATHRAEQKAARERMAAIERFVKDTPEGRKARGETSQECPGIAHTCCHPVVNDAFDAWSIAQRDVAGPFGVH